MFRSSFLVFSFLGFATPSLAADLDLTVAADGIGPVSVTLRDVAPGKLPSVDVEAPDGRSLRVDLELAESAIEGERAYDLMFTLTKSRLKGKGRRKVQTDLSRPTVRFKPDHDAHFTIGFRQPMPGTVPPVLERVNFLDVKARIHSGSAEL